MKGKQIEVSRLWAAYFCGGTGSSEDARHSAGFFGHIGGGHGTPARGGRESYDDGVLEEVLGFADALVRRVFQ